MKMHQVVAIALVVLGALALSYGGFTYTRDTHEADLGALSLSLEENKRVNIPVWAGVGGIVVGGLVFVFGRYPR